MAGIGKYKKGKKFELKSGNNISFKEMGSSPLKQADATLVNAAQNAAMANVPGDWSRSLNKQYEGIIASNQAVANIGSTIAAGAAELGIKGIKKKQKAKKQQAKQDARKEKIDAIKTEMRTKQMSEERKADLQSRLDDLQFGNGDEKKKKKKKKKDKDKDED
tara:strand:+ start:23 stop:508 length:486 start_codon:yes stop_codon:yes gene_type:complete